MKLFTQRNVFSRLVSDFNNVKNTTQIARLIKVLDEQFARSTDSNKRKGGLIGLAATSIALSKVILYNN